MKLTKEQLKQIIKEELAGLSEAQALPYDDPLVHRTRISSAADALSRLTGVLETDAAEGTLSDKDRDILREIKMWVQKLADAEQEVEDQKLADAEQEVEDVEGVEGVEGVEDAGDVLPVDLSAAAKRTGDLSAPRGINKDLERLKRWAQPQKRGRRRRNQ